MPRARNVAVLSEHDALTSAIHDITNGDYRDAIETLKALREQAQRGYHANPSTSRTFTPFRIVGVIGTDVHFIAYTHKDGKAYRHDFKGGNAEVLAVERHGKRELLITSPSGADLWDEF